MPLQCLEILLKMYKIYRAREAKFLTFLGFPDPWVPNTKVDHFFVATARGMRVPQPIFPPVTSQNFLRVISPERHMLLRRLTPLSIGNFMAHLMGYPLFNKHNNFKKFQKCPT